MGQGLQVQYLGHKAEEFGAEGEDVEVEALKMSEGEARGCQDRW